MGVYSVSNRYQYSAVNYDITETCCSSDLRTKEVGRFVDPEEPILSVFLILSTLPRGSIYTTTMELGPTNHPCYYGFWGPNSIMVVFMDPLAYMGSCQNYGPFLGTLNIRCRIIIRTQKGTII